MTNSPLMNVEQQDALQEIINISMGQAADSLARLIQSKITLSVPKITQSTPAEFQKLFSQKEQVYYSRQSFLGELRGEMLALLTKTGCDTLADVMQYPTPRNTLLLEEVILDITNILAGACLRGISKQLGLKSQLSPPMIFEPVLTDFSRLNWKNALLMEVNFIVESACFSSRVFICLEETSIGKLIVHIDDLLE